MTGIKKLFNNAAADGVVTQQEVDSLRQAAVADGKVSRTEQSVLNKAQRLQETGFEKAPGAQTRRGPSLGGAGPAAAVKAVAGQPTVTNPVMRTVKFVFDAGPHAQISNVQLKGSWDKATGRFNSNWDPQTVAMKSLGNGKYEASVQLADDGQAHDWSWGVVVDTPQAKGQWAVMGEGPRKFALDANTSTVSYAPTTYHTMGAQKDANGDATFRFWAPDAKAVQVKVTDKDGNVERIPMTREPNGDWSARVAGGFSRLEGKSYVYEVVDSGGQTLEKTDPYAREMMGEQRGLGRMYIDPTSGKEVNKFTQGRMELMRFEIDDQEDADSAYLVLRDASGKQLTKDEVLARVGTIDSSLIDKARNGQPNDLYSNLIQADGRIKMANVAGEWSALMPNLEKLEGLQYEFQVFDKGADGKLKLRGDANGDGKLSTAERKNSPVNDPWSNVITASSGVDFRGGVITDTHFDFKNDNAPRERDHEKWVIYQMHPGSFMGKANNVNRSTFEDMIGKLDYLKELGVNTLELNPTNEVEGDRDWGYMGANSLATESSLGFIDKDGQWVSGTKALKMFIDEAHKRGFNVINDVVYNHVGGDYNGMWNIDGKENPYFNWSNDPSKMEQRDTPWGAVPAYNKEKVKQFFVDHAVAQVEELHFDGLRFDFTEPIKGTGGKDGWDMLREINRQVHFYNPNAWTVCEQFDYDPAMTRPAGPDGTGGAGFDAQWYTEAQHRMTNDSAPFNPGLVQAAARGWKTNVDAFMSMLTGPRGLENWGKALQIISNHDEVGNAARTQNVAEGDQPTDMPTQWSRSAARFAAGIGLAGPGIPMFFQGDETLAQNEFRWGNPSTWDTGWSWESLGKNWDWNNLKFSDPQQGLYNRLFDLSPAQLQADSGYQALSAADKQVFTDLKALPPEQRKQAMIDIPRRQSFQFFKDAIALRNSSPAFRADAEVNRVYTSNDNSVMAFTRKAGNDEFLVVGSLNHQDFNGYRMDLPPGQWKEVFNSDASRYGGNNFGNFGGTLNGGNAGVNIPAAGYVVFKRVG